MTMKTRTISFIAVLGALLLQNGCAAVKIYDREKLADPIMQRESRFAKQTLSQKFFLSREGSIGGTLGIGGGCGCAK
jgi:hypothetical protein